MTMNPNANLEKFLGTEQDDDAASGDSVVKISLVGAESGRSISGWAILDGHCVVGMPYFRGYRDEWTRDIGQIRLYRSRRMAELARCQLMELEDDDE